MDYSQGEPTEYPTGTEFVDAPETARYRFIQIPMAVVEDTSLSAYAFRLYAVGRRFIGTCDPSCWPSQKKLAELCACSARQVRRATGELVKRGLWKVTPRTNPEHGGQTSNLITYLDFLAVYEGTAPRAASPPPPVTQSAPPRTPSPPPQDSQSTNLDPLDLDPALTTVPAGLAHVRARESERASPPNGRTQERSAAVVCAASPPAQAEEESPARCPLMAAAEQLQLSLGKAFIPAVDIGWLRRLRDEQGLTPAMFEAVTGEIMQRRKARGATLPKSIGFFENPLTEAVTERKENQNGGSQTHVPGRPGAPRAPGKSQSSEATFERLHERQQRAGKHGKRHG